MDTALIMNRIRRIEQRLARLESAAFGKVAPPPTRATRLPEHTPKPQPEPVPQAPESAAAPRPEPTPLPSPLEREPVAPVPIERSARPKTDKKPVEWERFFGMAVLGRIGVGAVLLAAGYFAQLAYRELPATLRVLSIYALAAAFIGVGYYLLERAHKRYVGLLWGGGAAAAYLAGIVARLRYDLVGPISALLLLVFASALGHVLARRLKHQTLASTALAGAFAAPMLIGATSESRTLLFLYLGMLYLWSAWMQRVWQWKSARIVALCGVGIVGGLWLLEHGAVDASTYWHLSGYVAVLVLPELLHALRRGTLQPGEEGGLVAFAAAASTLMLGMTFQQTAPDIAGTSLRLPAFGISAGLVWLLAASALAYVGRGRQNRMTARGLAHVGGHVLVVALWGIAAFGPHWFGIAARADAQLVGALLLAGASVGLTFHQRRVGAGDLAACVGTGFLAWLAFFQPSPTHAVWLGVLGGLGALAVMARSRSATLRGFTSWIGLVALGMGLVRATRWDDAWILLPFAACAVYVVLVQLLARWKRDRALVDNGLGMLAVLAWVWSLLGFIGTYQDVTLPILDAMTLGGLAIVAATFVGAMLVRQWNPRGARGRTTAWAALGMVALVVIGHRETISAVAALPGAARDAMHVTYLAVAAAVFAWVSARRESDGIGRLGIALLGIAVLKALTGVLDAPAGAWPSLALLAPMAATWFLTRQLAPRRTEFGILTLAAGAFLAMGWFGYALEERFPIEPALFNLRMGTGLALLALGIAMGAKLRRHTETDAAPLLLLSWVLALAYVVGLFEFLDLVRPLAGAWPRVLVSVYTTVFAAGLLALGFARGDRRLRYPALAGFGIVVLKVGLYDLGGTPIPLRILVTGVLGLVLLGAAFAYARTGKQEADAPDPEVRSAA